LTERQKQIILAKKRGDNHLGKNKSIYMK